MAKVSIEARRRLGLFAAVVALGLLASACADDPDGEQPPVEPPPACITLDASACEAAEHCAAGMARKVNDEELCFEPRAYAGCLEGGASRVCEDAETWVRAPDDALWLFQDGCVPEGWEKNPRVDIHVNQDCS